MVTAPAQLGRAQTVRIALAMEMGAMVSVQLGNALSMQLLDPLGVGGTSLLRLGFGGTMLLLIARPRLRGRSRAELRMVGALGVVLAVQTLMMFEAISRAPLGAAVTIGLLGPLGVAVAGSRGARQFVWPLLALAGVALVANPLGEGSVGRDGIAFAAAGALAWAAYIVLSARVGARLPGIEGLAVGVFLGGLLMLPLGLAQGGAALLDPSLLALGLLIALLTTALAYSLETLALKRISTRLFGVFASLEPAAATAIAFVLLSQRLGAAQLAGTALVIVACAGAARARGPAPII